MLKKHLVSFGKDTLFYGLGSTLGQLTALILVPFFSQVLIPEEYGVLAMLALFSQFIQPVFSLGLDNALFRFFSLSEHPEEQKSVVSTAGFIRTSASGIGILLLYFLFPITNDWIFDERLTATMWNLSLATMFAAGFSNIAEVIIRVQRKPLVMLAISLLNIIAGTLLSVWWVIVLKWGVTGALLSGLVTQVITAILYSFYLRPFIYHGAVSRKTAKSLLQYALPYIPHRIQAQLMQSFSLFIVNQQMGIVATGLYAMAGKFVKPLNLLVDSVQRAWVPYKFHIHKTAAEPSEVFRRMIGNYWLFLLLVWGAGCAVFPFFFKQLVDARYFDGIPYFPFLAFVPLSQAFYYTSTVGVELNKSQKILPVASFWGMLACVILALISGPVWSPYGPVLALIAGYLVIAGIVYQTSKKHFPVDFPINGILAVFVLQSSFLFYCYNYEIKWSILLLLTVLCSVLYILVFYQINYAPRLSLPHPRR